MNENAELPIRHPEANTSLFLGIASIILAFGALGLACAIFSMIAGSRAIAGYKEAPGRYTIQSLHRGRAGIICSVISIVLFLVAVFVVLRYYNL
jgi:hypothetical protein